jgi:hypothetical protein
VSRRRFNGRISVLFLVVDEMQVVGV